MMTPSTAPARSFGLPALRYPSPSRRSPPTSWGADWRRRWFRAVGSVHRYYLTGELVAFYSDARDPAARLALQTELEGRAGGVGEVLAACDGERAKWNRMVEAIDRRGSPKVFP